jgi:hypothetical protein
MKRIFLVLLVALIEISAIQAAGFNSRMTAEVIEMSQSFYDQEIISGKMVLEITRAKDGSDSYPVGTKIYSQMYSSHGDRYFENPKLYTSINKIVGPDGTTYDHDYDKLEIKPISGVKSYWIPFYRIINVLSKRRRTIGEGSVLTIKPASSGDVIAVLKNNKKLKN